jgi:hypothetical protein
MSAVIFMLLLFITVMSTIAAQRITHLAAENRTLKYRIAEIENAPGLSAITGRVADSLPLD